MQLAMKFDFPETVVGSHHESSDRLAIVSRVVGGDARHPTLNALGLV